MDSGTDSDLLNIDGPVVSVSADDQPTSVVGIGEEGEILDSEKEEDEEEVEEEGKEQEEREKKGKKQKEPRKERDGRSQSKRIRTDESTSLDRRKRAFERLKSMQFRGSGKNPFSMPISVIEERRKQSPHGQQEYEHSYFVGPNRQNIVDWNQPPLQSIHAKTGRRSEFFAIGQRMSPFSPFVRPPMPPVREKHRKQHQHREKMQQRQQNVHISPMLDDLEQKIANLSSGTRFDPLPDISPNDVMTLPPTELKRLIFVVQSIEREHTRMFSSRNSELIELRDTFVKNVNEVSLLKTVQDQQIRRKSGIPSLLGISVPPPVFNAPPPSFKQPPPAPSFPPSSSSSSSTSLFSIPPPSILGATSAFKTDPNSPFVSLSTMAPPTSNIAPFAHSNPIFSSASFPYPPPTSSSNALVFPSTHSMLSSVFERDSPQTYRSSGSRDESWKPQSKQTPERTQQRGGQQHGKRARFDRNRVGNQQRNGRQDRRTGGNRQISEIVAIIPDEHDHRKRNLNQNSEMVVVIPDDDEGIAILEAESKPVH